MDLLSAKQNHFLWKLKFQAAIKEHTELDVTTISSDNCCELGKWLYGDAKLKFGLMKSYTECLQTHTAFHIAAGKVAEMINEKRYEDAEKMLENDSAFAVSSRDVDLAIVHLKKEAGV